MTFHGSCGSSIYMNFHNSTSFFSKHHLSRGQLWEFCFLTLPYFQQNMTGSSTWCWLGVFIILFVLSVHLKARTQMDGLDHDDLIRGWSPILLQASYLHLSISLCYKGSKHETVGLIQTWTSGLISLSSAIPGVLRNINFYIYRNFSSRWFLGREREGSPLMWEEEPTHKITVHLPLLIKGKATIQ